MKYRYYISDFKDHCDAGPWRSYDLQAEGDTLEELLDNAWIFEVSQDGESLRDYKADCRESLLIIHRCFEKESKNEI